MEIKEFIRYLQEKKLSKNTLLSYQSDLKNVEEFIKKPLIKATEKDIHNYFRYIQDLKATTIRRRHIAVKRFFSYAEKMNLIDEDPSGNLESPKLPQSIPKYMSSVEIDNLLKNLNNDNIWNLRNSTIVKLLYYTGMRIGEVQLLNIEDINWDNFQVRVKGKGNKERIIPLNTNIVKTLKEWINVRSTIKCDSNALFISYAKNRRGKRISYGVIRQIVKEVLKNAGLGSYSPHKIRHTFATRLLSKGVPLEQISKLLGHSRLDTTLIYAHTEVSKLRSAVESL